MAKFRVVIEQEIEVELDENKFDETFMAEFRESFFSFDTLEEHAEHIAQLQARGVIDLTASGEFIEGYGPSQDMGIKAKVVEFEIYDAEPISEGQSDGNG